MSFTIRLSKSNTSTVDKFTIQLEHLFGPLHGFSSSVYIKFFRQNISILSNILYTRFLGTASFWHMNDPLALLFLYKELKYPMQGLCVDLKYDFRRFLARYKFSDEIASSLFRLLSRVLTALRTLYTQGLRSFLHPEINLRYYYDSIIDRLDNFERELTSRLEFTNG